MDQVKLFSMRDEGLIDALENCWIKIIRGDKENEAETLQEIHLLKNTIFARIAHAMPPFIPGQKVVTKVGSVESIYAPLITLSPEQVYEVELLIYKGKAKWQVQLKGVHINNKPSTFPAEKFIVASVHAA